jgi:hypothetical protein
MSINLVINAGSKGTFKPVDITLNDGATVKDLKKR